MSIVNYERSLNFQNQNSHAKISKTLIEKHFSCKSLLFFNVKEFFQIALLGFISVASVGPTNVMAIKEGFKKNGKSTFFILMGGVTVDIFYAILATIGLSYLGENIYYRIMLLLIGSIFFFYLGYSGLKFAFNKNISDIAIYTKRRSYHPFFLGVVMTLPNPFMILFWGTALTSIQVNYSIIIPVAIFTVGVAWSTIEAIMVNSVKEFLKEKYLKILEVFVALILLAFSLKFIFQLCIELYFYNR